MFFQMVLENFNFTIQNGQTVAIVGPSGSGTSKRKKKKGKRSYVSNVQNCFDIGKSTLCSLLVRFYDPLNGRITIDGKDLRELNATWLRSNMIGMINQV